jgi:predicted DNA-binding transcriptional regulator YafY
MHLRIDRIKKIAITKEPVRHFSEVSDYKRSFDSADYAGKLFNMYSGEPKPIEIVCENDLLETMLDRFGERVKVQKVDDNSFLLRTNAVVSDGLAAWVLQFGGRVTVKMPKELIRSVKEKAHDLLDKYE